MSVQEGDREDLFAEATALAQRVELIRAANRETIVAGCRQSGAWSIYFGEDPCYHFDPHGRLRRAYVNQQLYRSHGTILARLSRVRRPDIVELQRSDLHEEDCRQFLNGVATRLAQLRLELENGALICRRRFPQDSDMAGRLREAIIRILADGLQLSPAIPTRRG